MNAELARIRLNKNYKEAINRKHGRVKDSRIDEIIYQLNTNLNAVDEIRNDKNPDINIYINAFIANIYILLNAFNEVAVYPDYFYDEFFKLKIEYQRLLESNEEIRNNHRLMEGIKLSTRARISKITEDGLEKGYGHIQAYQKKDINDAFLEMIGFFQAFNIPYGISTPEQCRKAFNQVRFNQQNILSFLEISDYLSDDVECFVRLLFEYLTFFVAIGVNPKELLDNYIDVMANKEEEKKSQK